MCLVLLARNVSLLVLLVAIATQRQFWPHKKSLGRQNFLVNRVQPALLSSQSMMGSHDLLEFMTVCPIWSQEEFPRATLTEYGDEACLYPSLITEIAFCLSFPVQPPMMKTKGDDMTQNLRLSPKLMGLLGTFAWDMGTLRAVGVQFTLWQRTIFCSNDNFQLKPSVKGRCRSS